MNVERKTNHQEHDCFLEAVKTLRAIGGRRQFFIWIGNMDVDDAHFWGNTATPAAILNRLVKTVLETHTDGSCSHCDAVANALKDAKLAFDTAMEASKGRTC